MSGIKHTFEAKCREHWNRMGYSNPEKLKERILEVFAQNTDQHYAITGVYRLVIPEWDEIEKLVGYPEAGMELCLFICRQCQEFDQKYHPNCMPSAIGTTATIVATTEGSKPIRELPGVRSSMRMQGVFQAG